MKLKNITIKPLNKDHLKDILEIQKHEKNNPFFKSESKNGFLTHFEERGFLLGIFHEDNLIGYSKFWFPGNESEMGKEIGLKNNQLIKLAYFNGTVILKEYRGHNLQKKLHEKAIEVLKHQGFKYITCTVHPDNKASLTNLNQEGFKISHEKSIHNSIRLVLYKKI